MVTEVIDDNIINASDFLSIHSNHENPGSKKAGLQRSAVRQTGMPAGCPAHTKYVNEFNGPYASTMLELFWI